MRRWQADRIRRHRIDYFGAAGNRTGALVLVQASDRASTYDHPSWLLGIYMRPPRSTAPLQPTVAMRPECTLSAAASAPHPWPSSRHPMARRTTASATTPKRWTPPRPRWRGTTSPTPRSAKVAKLLPLRCSTASERRSTSYQRTGTRSRRTATTCASAPRHRRRDVAKLFKIRGGLKGALKATDLPDAFDAVAFASRRRSSSWPSSRMLKATPTARSSPTTVLRPSEAAASPLGDDARQGPEGRRASAGGPAPAPPQTAAPPSKAVTAHLFRPVDRHDLPAVIIDLVPT